MNITKSELSVLKLELMTSHGAGTRGLSDTAILQLARDKGVIDNEYYSKVVNDSKEEQPQPKRAVKKPAKKEEQPAQPNDNALAQMQQLMAQMFSKQGGMTQEQVIELINEHSPRTTFSVRINDFEPLELESVVHECFEKALNHLAIGNQLYFHGGSGSGKSTTAKLLAQSLECECYIQGAILAKFEALGSLTATGYNKSVIRQWLENPEGGLLCIDEIDASCPRALVTLMSIFDLDGELTFPDGETFKRTPDHLLIVTANTVGTGASAKYVGRTRLDRATLNRFVQIEHGYSERIENTLADEHTVKYCRKFRTQVENRGLEGALITPRTILQAGKVAASKLGQGTKANMVYDILKQGLTDSEFNSIRSNVGNY